MKIIVFGDIHGATVNLMKLTPAIKSADMAVFVGDGAGSLEVLDEDARKKLVAVRGNCDFFSGLPSEAEVNGIFVSHGHEYDVKTGINLIKEAAIARDAKICFFGHNHRPSAEVVDGITFINPGTLGNSRTESPNMYAVVTINGEKINVEHKII